MTDASLEESLELGDVPRPTARRVERDAGGRDERDGLLVQRERGGLDRAALVLDATETAIEIREPLARGERATRVLRDAIEQFGRDVAGTGDREQRARVLEHLLTTALVDLQLLLRAQQRTGILGESDVLREVMQQLDAVAITHEARQLGEVRLVAHAAQMQLVDTRLRLGECVVGLLVLVAPQLRADPHEDRAEHRGQHAAAHEPEPDHPHALDQELQHDAADHGDDAEHEQREPRHAPTAARGLDAAQRLRGRRAQLLMLLGLAEELRVEFGLLTQQLQTLRGQLREAHLQVLDLLGHVALRRERVAQLEHLMPQHGVLHEQLSQFRGVRDADVGILGGEALVGDQFATLAIDRLALTVELLAAMRVRMIERAHGLVVTREQIAQVTLGARGDRGAGGQFGGLDLESCDLGERLVLLGDPLAQRARVPGATLDLERAQVLLQLLLLLPQLLQLIDRRLDLEQSRIELTQTDLALGALGLEPHEGVVERARETDLGRLVFAQRAVEHAQRLGGVGVADVRVGGVLESALERRTAPRLLIARHDGVEFALRQPGALLELGAIEPEEALTDRVLVATLEEGRGHLAAGAIEHRDDAAIEIARDAVVARGALQIECDAIRPVVPRPPAIERRQHAMRATIVIEPVQRRGDGREQRRLAALVLIEHDVDAVARERPLALECAETVDAESQQLHSATSSHCGTTSRTRKASSP